MYTTDLTYKYQKLTGGFFTDVTNTHRTMLVDINEPFKYDGSMLAYFGIDECYLPLILPNKCDYGECLVGDKSIPIVCSIGDQQAAYYGMNTSFNRG